MNCSDETAAAVDQEVMALLKESYAEAKRLLSENRQVLNKIAEYLIDKETISGHEFMEIYCREKGLPMPGKEAGDKAAVIGEIDDEVKYTEEGKEIISVTRGRGEKKPDREETPAPSYPAYQMPQSAAQPGTVAEAEGPVAAEGPVKTEGPVSAEGPAPAEGPVQPQEESSPAGESTEETEQKDDGNPFARELKNRMYREKNDKN